MEELIAKRYIKALAFGSDTESLQNMTLTFQALAESFKDDRFVSIITNPDVKSADKSSILLDAVKAAKSDKVNNLIKLLVEHKRINIIPAMADELKKDLAHSTKTYTGVIFSDADIDAQVVEDLSAGLSKKYDSKISLSFTKNDFNGIKVEVSDLGIEINFSKDRIDSQLVEHIIKAI
jgi:F-type H+-transporting ATPase subunit delta